MKCIKPDFRQSSEYEMHDPACGTGGFLIGAFEWIMKQTNHGSKLTIKDRERLVKKTFSGMDIVQNTRRLALMNCYLHELEAQIHFGDALGEGIHVNKRYDVILTNPPFGSRGAGGAPSRDDFLFSTSNKQLNFVQHSMTVLKLGGKAGIVVPDGVLGGTSGKDLRENLLKNCDVHTILRLPEGTFTPYAAVKANVVFFTKGTPTKEVWVYNLRTTVRNINKSNPLTEKLFEDFEKCYDQKPRLETDRFKKFSISHIVKGNYNLDVGLNSTYSVDEDVIEPEILIKEIDVNLQTAVKSLNELTTRLKRD